jgi:hypothetical protein
VPGLGYPVFGVVGVVGEGHGEAVRVGGEPSGEESQEAAISAASSGAMLAAGTGGLVRPAVQAVAVVMVASTAARRFLSR